jgi:hypothetical protein
MAAAVPARQVRPKKKRRANEDGHCHEQQDIAHTEPEESADLLLPRQTLVHAVGSLNPEEQNAI